MFLPNNPILLPKPKFVQCPKCEGTWYWRTWYKGSERTTCSKCKLSVTPQEISGNKTKLIKCPKCHGLQWYTGDKSRTSCTVKDCNKKNMIVHAITPEELYNILQPFWNGLVSLEIEEYYLERMKECTI
jgi:Zn-finger nucleic acid-binding protein